MKNATIDIGVKGTDTTFGTGFCTLNQRLMTELKFAIGDRMLYVSGKAQVMETAPFYKDKRTTIPLRAFAEAMGATVTYHSDSDIRISI